MRKARGFWFAAETVEPHKGDEDDVSDAYVTLCIHAGIAASDVICCKRLGEHAHGQNHDDAVSHLAQVDKMLAKDLGVLLDMKTRAGYSSVPIEAAGVRRSKRAAKRLIDAAVEAFAV